MSKHFEQKEWAQAGKALMMMSGVACICLAFYRGEGALAFVLRAWVGLFGLFCSYIALRDARPDC